MMNINIKVSTDTTDQLAKASGYTLPSAVKELIDNSIGAHAKRIDVQWIPGKDGNLLGYVVVSDNGEGMDIDRLQYHFFNYGKKCETGSKYNNTSPYRKDPLAPNMFGVGGKQGITYAAPRENSGDVDREAIVTIVTKMAGKPKITVEWNIREKTVFADWDDNENPTDESGTTITFPVGKHCEPIDVLRLKADLSLTYYPFIAESDKAITLNDDIIPMSDPLHDGEPNLTIKSRKYVIKSLTSNKPIVVGINSTFFDVNQRNTVPSDKYNLAELVHKPARALTSSMRKNPKVKNTLRRTSLSGIFLRTAKRLYTYGANFSLLGYTQHPNSNGLRIVVDIPKSFWNTIDMTWNKGDKITKFTLVEEFNDRDRILSIEDYVIDQYGQGEWIPVKKQDYVSVVGYLRNLYSEAVRDNSTTNQDKEARNKVTRKTTYTKTVESYTAETIYNVAVSVFGDEETAKMLIDQCREASKSNVG